jgi:cell division protein FtsW
VTTAAGSGSDDVARTGLRAALAQVERMLGRPLASYHLVLGSAGLLLALGLVMVLSASSVYSFRTHGSAYYVFLRQAAWVAAGLPLAWAVSRANPSLVRRFGYPLLLGSVALLVLTYVPGIGVVVNGNRNWIDLGGPFRLQPSELAKLALVVWGAHVYARKGRLLGQWKHLVVPFVPGAAVVVALTVGQGDLGTALVLMAIVLALLWIVGVPGWLFALAMGTVATIGLYFVTAEQYRLDRVRSFLDPFADLEGTGWQAAHSIYAFATGEWWGVGLGASRQKWGSLPEAHTDFIFAVVGEELGLFGSLVVLCLFLVLGYAGIRIAWRARDSYVRLTAAGITGWLLAQALVNMGAVLGLLPITGIPLPLVSYGGSALLPTLVAVGLLVSFARQEPGAAEALAARRLAWSARRAGAPAGGGRP